MSLALGQNISLSALVRDETGALDNAGTVTLTITLPDGTTTSPIVSNPPTVTGTYVYVYAPTVPGLHAVRWVFSGDNASAPLLDAFYVESATVAPLVSLAEARQYCRLSSPADDAEVQRFALVTSDLCERYTQVWRRVSLTETFDGGVTFLRLRPPVVSVTTVVEGGVTLASIDWTLDKRRGWLYRGTTRGVWLWAPGRQNVVVTYVAGSAGDIPASVRQGVLLLVRHLWDSQRGGSGLPRQSGTDFTYDPRTGFTIPNAVLELWRPHMPPMVA